MKTNILLSLLILFPAAVWAEDEAHPKMAEPLAVEEAQALHQIMLDRLVQKKPQFTLVGAFHTDKHRQLSINGEPFSMDEKTRVQGVLVEGATVEVRGFIEHGKSKMANQIVVMGTDQVQSTAPDSEEQAVDLTSKPGLIDPHGSR